MAPYITWNVVASMSMTEMWFNSWGSARGSNFNVWTTNVKIDKYFLYNLKFGEIGVCGNHVQWHVEKANKSGKEAALKVEIEIVGPTAERWQRAKDVEKTEFVIKDLVAKLKILKIYMERWVLGMMNCRKIRFDVALKLDVTNACSPKL